MRQKNNKQITWVNFLHIYQPPWQDQDVVKQIAIQSYEYLLELGTRFPNFKMTLNVTGSLIDQLELFRPDLLKKIQRFVKNGQIELTSSAKFHAFLPLLPKPEIYRQIKLNQETLARYFDIKKIRGFYFPEMAFSQVALSVIKKFGFEWIILDPIHYDGQIDNKVLYISKKMGLKVVFRSRVISKKYPPEEMYKLLKTDYKEQTIISAHDGETYGHFHTDWQGHIEKVILHPAMQIKTVHEYLKSLKEKNTISLRSATWESTEKDIKNKRPWLLWNDPSNKIHQSLWKLAYLAIGLLKKYSKDSNHSWAREHLDRGLSSCSFWWSTAKKPSAFSSVTWSPDMIDNGAEELIRSVRTLQSPTTKEKITAEKIYLDIMKNTWFTHWQRMNNRK